MRPLLPWCGTIAAVSLLAAAHLATSRTATASTRAPAAETPAARSSDPAPEKRGYHLLRPTPAHLLREMSTDRPDLTESPFTVDAGHAQVEIEALSYSQDRSPGEKVRSFGFAGFLLKLGLSPRLDLQAGFESVVRRDHFHAEYAEPLGAGGPGSTDVDGPSDLLVRLKWNLWGNDRGALAAALMPFLDFPTEAGAPGRSLEGGLILPVALPGPADIGLGAMVELDWLENAEGGGHHAEWLTTATASRALVGPLDGFVEFAAGFRPKREGAWVGSVNAGLTYGLTPNTQLDGGVRAGVSEAANDIEVFAGLSLRR